MDEIIVQKLFDKPVAFHRVFVDLTGSVQAALMLSQAFYWSKRTSLPDGWFYKSSSEWTEETGLTRHEQDTARKHLKKTAFWKEKLRGVPATCHFNIDKTALFSSLLEIGKQVSSGEQFAINKQTSMPDNGKHSITEITTENTFTESKDSVPKKPLISEPSTESEKKSNKGKGAIEFPEYKEFIAAWVAVYKTVGIKMPRDGAKVKSLILTTREQIKMRGVVPTPENTVEFWQIFVNNLHKTWGHGKDLATIDSKYTSLIFELENGKSTTAKKPNAYDFINNLR